MNQPSRFCAISAGVLVAYFVLFSVAIQTAQAQLPAPLPTSCSTTTIDMKLLVVTNGKTESDYPAIKQILDRKSTRLNSSHSQISYAVFCLKKKNHVQHCLPHRGEAVAHLARQLVPVQPGGFCDPARRIVPHTGLSVDALHLLVYRVPVFRL